MKNLIKISILSIAVMVSACKKEAVEEVLPNAPGVSALDDAFDKVQLINEDMVTNPEVLMADESLEFEVVNDGLGDDPEVTAKRRRAPLCFHACLVGLKLDSNQRKALHQAKMSLNQCRLPLVRQIRHITVSIIMHANLQRAKLVGDFRSGKITKQQLVAALHKLHKQTRHKIANHPQRLALIKQLKGCYKTFKAALGNILTPAQKKQFASCASKC